MKRANLWTWILRWIVLAVAYFATGRLCIAVSAFVANVSWVLYIPAGLSLTASLLWGAWVWPGVFLGELAATLGSGQPPLSCLLMGCGNGLDAALAGWWLHDRIGRRLEFDRLPDVMRLLIAELFVLQPLSAAMGIFALRLAGHLPPDQIWSVASAWYASNVFAQFVSAPAVLAWMRWKRPVAHRHEYLELAAAFAVTLLIGFAGTGHGISHTWLLPVALFFVVPLLVWAAVRFLPSIPLTVGTVLGLFAFSAMLSHTGPFRATEAGDQVLRLNVFMGVCLGTALFLAAAMGQQRRFEQEQTRLIADLSAALSQVKRLEEFVTFCAWTGRVRWKDQWISVEKFLQDRYNVNISHGISEEALTALLKELPPADGPSPAV